MLTDSYDESCVSMTKVLPSKIQRESQTGSVRNLILDLEAREQWDESIGVDQVFLGCTTALRPHETEQSIRVWWHSPTGPQFYSPINKGHDVDPVHESNHRAKPSASS